MCFGAPCVVQDIGLGRQSADIARRRHLSFIEVMAVSQRPGPEACFGVHLRLHAFVAGF